jgi:hypothetical protein
MQQGLHGVVSRQFPKGNKIVRMAALPNTRRIGGANYLVVDCFETTGYVRDRRTLMPEP